MSKSILCENGEGGVDITPVQERVVNTPKGRIAITVQSALAAMQAANPDKTYTLVDTAVVNAKYEESPFRRAWKPDLTTDLDKAKEIAHDARRVKRDNAYSSVDGGAMNAVLNDAGEAERAAIKTQDDALQVATDEAAEESELKALMVDNGLI